MSSSDTKNFLYPILIAVGSSTDNFTVGLTIGLKIENSSLKNLDSDVKAMDRNVSISWPKFNLIIALCNATGAWAAGKGGLYALNEISHYFNYNNHDEPLANAEEINEEENDNVQNMASLMAAVAFSFLAMDEFKSYLTSSSPRNGKEDVMDPKENEEVSNEKPQVRSILALKNAMQLAIPMTLNNLAGGVAGGTIGVSAENSFIMAFIFSYLMMDVGYRLARSATIKSGNTKILNSLDCNLISGAVFSILASSQLWDYFGC